MFLVVRTRDMTSPEFPGKPEHKLSQEITEVDESLAAVVHLQSKLRKSEGIGWTAKTR